MENTLAHMLDVEELDEIRTAVEEKVQEINACYRALSEMFEKVSTYINYDLKRCASFNDDEMIDTRGFMQAVDTALWDYVLTATTIRKYTTQESEQYIKATIESEKKPFSKDAASLLTYNIMKNSGGIMGFTIKEVFNALINAYFYSTSQKKQNQHKIEKSFRMTVGIVPDYYGKWSLRNYGKRGTLLNDVETACRILDGKTRLDYPHRIYDKIDRVSCHERQTFENDYFVVTLYKNGNCKIDFKTDIYEKINYYGSRGDSLSFFEK